MWAMKLAFQNILYDRVRFTATVLGIAFAVCLMVFQGSLLTGFLHASARLIDATQSDLWITARGVACFDFPAALSKRFVEVSQGVPGVARASRIVSSMAMYRKPDGRHQMIALVGADPEVGASFPVPFVHGSRGVLEPDGILVDRSGADLLEIAGPGEIEINNRRAHLVGEVEGFSSFLGSPYVFTSYVDAARYLGLRADEAMYILIRLRAGFPIEQVKRQLQTRLPDVDVLTREEFARRSQIYWISQTGAGGGIMAAAILGFLVGLVIVSQTIYATTMENLEEFATLKALGASRWYVAKIVLIQALICGLIGNCIGVAVTFPLVEQAQRAIPWVQTPWWLPAGIIGPSVAMCCLAALVSIRAALNVEPARVFRA
jgi:putative ABC transport system permease protein